MKVFKYLFMLFLAFVSVTANAQEELILNGDFELNPKVQRGTNATTGWDSRKPVVVVYVDPISAENPHYAVICCDTLYNQGNGEISIADGTKFDLSISLRNIPDYKADKQTCGNKLVIVQLVNELGVPVCETTIRVKGNAWQTFNRQFTANSSCTKARLAIVGTGCGKIAIDKVSLKKH